MNTKTNAFSLYLRMSFLIVAMAGMAGCAPVQERVEDEKPRLLIYPPPPDEPRYVFERTIYGSADVTPRKSDAALKRALTGEMGTPPG